MVEGMPPWREYDGTPGGEASFSGGAVTNTRPAPTSQGIIRVDMFETIQGVTRNLHTHIKGP